jgi:broad specificity phosphatase PhoE
MARKDVLLVVVRHGEGTHNLPEGAEGRAVVRNPAGDVDTQLTPLGREQAGRVGRRLAGLNPDLAISSHLARARDTALAVLEHHVGVLLEEWSSVKERCKGDLDYGVKEYHGKSVQNVKDGGRDRSALQWRPPGLGAESIADLNLRVKAFLAEVMERAMELPTHRPTVP